MTTKTEIYRQMATLYGELANLEGNIPDVSSPPVMPPVTVPNADPRTLACRGHAMQDGVVTGIYIGVHRNPNAKYKCVFVDMLTVAQSGGNPNMLVKAPNGVDIRMGTGYNAGSPFQYDAILLPGNPENRFFMSAKFNPPDVGPLAFFIVENGVIVSDVVGSWGLPYGHHIGGVCEFQRV